MNNLRGKENLALVYRCSITDIVPEFDYWSKPSFLYLFPYQGYAHNLRCKCFDGL